MKLIRSPVTAINVTVTFAYGMALWQHAVSPEASTKAPDSPPLAAFTVVTSASSTLGDHLFIIDPIVDERRGVSPATSETPESVRAGGPTKKPAA